MYSNAGGVAGGRHQALATRLIGRPQAPVLVASVQQAGRTSGLDDARVLVGDPEAPAIAAIPDVIANSPAPASEIDMDADGNPRICTRLQIAFARTATVAQVNSVLAALDAVVVDAVAGVPIVVVRIPDPGTVAALDAVIAGAAEQPAVRSVLSVLLPAPSDLPDTHPPGPRPPAPSITCSPSARRPPGTFARRSTRRAHESRT